MFHSVFFLSLKYFDGLKNVNALFIYLSFERQVRQYKGSAEEPMLSSRFLLL